MLFKGDKRGKRRGILPPSIYLLVTLTENTAVFLV